MLKIGSYNDLVVDSAVEFGYYLHSDDERILLPNKYAPEDIEIGKTIRVFVYTDSEDRPIATTLEPKGCVDDFVFLKAKDVTSIGTFMEWGLEKDLLVPKSEQQDRMVAGKKYLVKICLDDKTDRVFGTAKISTNCDKDTKALNPLEEVDLLIHTKTNIGIMAVVNNRYYGMLYKNETYRELSQGEQLKGYVMRIRDDGKIDLTLKKPGFKSVDSSAEKVLGILKKEGGSLPYHDKSDPEDIKEKFSMSKKEFKKSIGTLLKKGVIEILDQGIKLKE